MATRAAMGIDLDEVDRAHGRVRAPHGGRPRAGSGAAARRAAAQPGRDADAVPDRPGRRGRAVDRRPRRRSLRARRARAAGARSPPASSTSTRIPNKTWQGRHLINTRGCGLVMAPASRVRETDLPDYQQPSRSPDPSCTSARASAAMPSPAASRASGSAPVARRRTYEGTAGVRMSSFVRRAAFALAFLDYNVLGSGAIDGDSQMLWVRNVRDRLVKLAPFLSYDGDPYPVVVEGRIKWVVDAYTSTSHYPYAQRIGGDVQLTLEQRARPRRQLHPQQRQGGRRRLRRLGHVLRPATRPTRSSRPGRAPSATCSRRPRRCRPSCSEHLRYPEDLFRVADRRLLEVPARRRTASSSAGARGRWPRRRASTRANRRARRRRRRATTSRRRSRTSPPRPRPTASRRTTRCSRARRRGRGLRHPAPVRAVLARRPAHRAAGLHDGLERPGQLRAADRLRRARPRRPDRARWPTTSTPSRRSPS